MIATKLIINLEKSKSERFRQFCAEKLGMMECRLGKIKKKLILRRITGSAYFV